MLSSMLPPRPRPSVNAAVSVLYLRSFFNAAWAGLGTLPDGPQRKSSESSSAQLHGRPVVNAGEGQLKTWTRTIQEDLALLGGPRAYDDGTRMAQDRHAWSAFVGDAVNALEAGQFRPE